MKGTNYRKEIKSMIRKKSLFAYCGYAGEIKR